MADATAQALQRSAADPAAFSEFYRQHADALLRYFVRRVLEAELAVDLTAETMARAFLRRQKFRGSTDEAAAAWLYSIASSLLSSYYRRQKVEHKALRQLGMERPQPVDEAEARMIEREALAEVQEQLQAGLEFISTSQREVIELRFLGDLSYPEIAERLKISEQAARSRLSRGIKELRDTLVNRQQPIEASP